ncbi:MAG: FAD-binding oxidoreductase [Pseudolabrys sp.]|nr:FAD-binding oxidoreductase [Pseudolabrys sp.]MBV9954288.1 FAD-binding oxidoreductase [Pseudolabrys sp.]
MARTDVIVLGAGIVGTSIALQLARRGRSVALIDRKPPGEETSYGNAGIIEGNTIFPPTFPADLPDLLSVIFKRAASANYHFSFLPNVLPWINAFRLAGSPAKLAEHARLIRPLFGAAVAEHETLMNESGATRYLRKTGWLKVYRNEKTVERLAPERKIAADFGIAPEVLAPEEALALEPSLNPVFRRGIYWRAAASISNPLAVTQAYAARFSALGGVMINGDALSLHRNGGRWRVETHEGPIDAEQAVVALGPWAPDLLAPMGLKFPMGLKRGYHRHFRAKGNATLARPILDADVGYSLTPMEQGFRVTTGAEFAARDALPTPVQFDLIVPKARELFPLGERADDKTWLGARPCFPDSRPIIDRAPGQAGLWLAIGHAHWGLTLGPVTGRLIADMMAGQMPFVDPAPYRAMRFS